MLKKIIYVAMLCLFMTNLTAQEKPNAKIFLEKFSPYKGLYFEGQIKEGGKAGDGFTGEKLLMQVQHYGDREVRIPFYVGENKSRTWILSYSNSTLLLKHDHRHADGSADSITFYGGYATNAGSATMQVFPADTETCELLEHACQNIWWMTLSDEGIFTYNLRRIGSDRLFTVEFDLNKAVQSDFKPW